VTIGAGSAAAEEGGRRSCWLLNNYSFGRSPGTCVGGICLWSMLLQYDRIEHRSAASHVGVGLVNPSIACRNSASVRLWL